MSSIITNLRAQIIDSSESEPAIRTAPEVYTDILGSTVEAQAQHIGEALIPDDTPDAATHRAERKDILTYIVKFLHNSTFQARMLAPIGKGVNLAERPYLAPTGLIIKGDGDILPAIDITDDDDRGVFRFQEQYRWDTYFQNKFLLLIGADKLAINQMLNLVDVFNLYERIPNALTTEFLSHPQPPFESLAAYDILEARQAMGKETPAVTDEHGTNWFEQVMEMAEKDLFKEWWDYGSERIHPRQDPYYHGNSEPKGKEAEAPFYSKDKRPTLTRYTSIHYHPLIVGCQDGKDHNRINAHYGENYLSVQLHALIWALVDRLVTYYDLPGKDKERKQFYVDALADLKHDINELMWDDRAPENGAFRNYSLKDGAPIEYGDLSAEVFPLFVGLATPEQAKKTMNNLKRYYAGDIGLASTSLQLRTGSPLAETVPGWADDDTQWELNTWPPLMMVAVEGLLNYEEVEGTKEFATDLMQRWVAWLEYSFYDAPEGTHGVIREKTQYDTRVTLPKGFYGNLPGFGWTIAAYGTFLNRLSGIEGGIEGIKQYRDYFVETAVRIED